MKKFFVKNKPVLILSGLLIFFGLLTGGISIFWIYSTHSSLQFSFLFGLFLSLPLYLANAVMGSLVYRSFVGYPLYNTTNWILVIVGFLLNIVYIFYLSKAIIYLKHRMNKKLFIVWAVVLLFFLLGLDYQLVKSFDKPDLSCVSDIDCKADFNQYSNFRCDYSCYNNKWDYYKPLLLRVFATKSCGSSYPCKCIQNKCGFVIDYGRSG